MASFGSDFYTWIYDSCDAGAWTAAHGGADAKIGLKISGGKLFVICDGEPDGKAMIDAFKDALASGKLGLDMPALIDLTRFTGAVDWAALTEVRDMAKWGEGERKNRVAYVVRNDAFSILIKAAVGLFGHSVHKAFYKREDALAWLDATD